MVTIVPKTTVRPLTIQVDENGIPRRLAEASSIAVSGLNAVSIVVDSISAITYLGAPVGATTQFKLLTDTSATWVASHPGELPIQNPDGITFGSIPSSAFLPGIGYPAGVGGGQLIFTDSAGNIGIVGAGTNEWFLSHDGTIPIWSPKPTYSIDELNGVNTAGESAGKFFVFDGSQWVPSSVVITGVNTLSALTDTRILTTPTTGQILTWSATKWIASAAPTGGGTGTVTSVTGTAVANNLIKQTGPTTAIVRDLSAGSNKLSITSATDYIAYDVVPANIAITAFSGTLPVPKGGTGLTSVGTDKIPVGNGTDTLSVLTIGTNLVNNAGSLNVTAAGSDTQVQYNNGNALGANANLTFNSATGQLKSTQVSAASAVFTQVSATTYLNLGIGTSALSALSDVTATPVPTTGQSLVWNGTRWQASTPATGGTGTLTSVVGAGTAANNLVKQTGPTTAIIRDASAASTRITITSALDVIAYDVSEAALVLNNIGGTLGVAKGGTGQTTFNTNRLLGTSSPAGTNPLAEVSIGANLSLATNTLAFTPAGADTQIQFNDANALAGNANLTFAKTTGLLKSTQVSATSATFVQVSATTYLNLGIGTSALSGLSDTNITPTPTTGQVLAWNGSKWAASTPPAPGAGTLTSVTGAGTAANNLVKQTGPTTAIIRDASAASTRITITSALDVIAYDVSEAALVLNNIGGTLGVAKGGTGQTTFNSGKLLGTSATGTTPIAEVSLGANLTLGSNTLAVTAAGADTQVQYNNSNSLGANANLTFNSATGQLKSTQVSATSGSFIQVSAATYLNLGIGTSALSGLSDTLITTTPTNNQALVWSSTKWVPSSIPNALSADTDTSILTTPTTGQVLAWNGSKWAASSPAGGTGATALSGLSDVSSGILPATNQVLAWNGTKWTAVDPTAGSGGSPNGVSTELQYRVNSTTFGGAEGTSWNSSTLTLSATPSVSVILNNLSGINLSSTTATLVNVSSTYIQADDYDNLDGSMYGRVYTFTRNLYLG